jgi:hypothetical protein
MSIPVLVHNKKKGIIYFNPTKRFTAPRWYLPNAAGSGVAGAVPSIIALAANGNSGNIPIEFDEGNGHAEIFAIVAESTGAFEFSLLDQGRKHNWQNRPIHNLTAAGVAQRPFILPVTYFLNVERGTRQITLNITDLSGAPNTIRFGLLGRAFFIKQAPQDVRTKIQNRFGMKERTLTYMLTTNQAQTAIAAATRTRAEFIVPSDYPLELMKMTVATDPANVDFDFELIDYSSGRRYSAENLRISRALGWGNAQYPHIPFESFFLPRNYRLQIDYWHTGVGATDFFFTLTGAKTMIPQEMIDA